jgi:hypothetical protein
MLGAEMTKLDEPTLELLTKEPLYKMMNSITSSSETFCNDNFIIWEAVTPEGNYAAVFNISDKAADAPFEKLDKKYDGAVEIWSGKTINFADVCTIPSHGAILLSI